MSAGARAHKPLKSNHYMVLLVLADGDLHAYGIRREIARRSHGSIQIGPGSFHRAIRQLVEEGLIEESDFRLEPALDDARRKYYRLTDAGLRAARAETERLEDLVAAAKDSRLGSA